MSCRSLPGAGAGLSQGTISSSDDIGGIIVLAIDIGLLKLKEAGTIDMRLSLELIILYGLWGENKQDKN